MFVQCVVASEVIRISGGAPCGGATLRDVGIYAASITGVMLCFWSGEVRASPPTLSANAAVITGSWRMSQRCGTDRTRAHPAHAPTTVHPPAPPQPTTTPPRQRHQHSVMVNSLDSDNDLAARSSMGKIVAAEVAQRPPSAWSPR